MAKQAGQEYDPQTDQGRIRIFPEGLAATSGEVLDDKRVLLTKWRWDGSGDVWCSVGSAKSGLITESGFDDNPWKIITLGA